MVAPPDVNTPVAPDEERWPVTLRRALTGWWGLLLLVAPVVAAYTTRLATIGPSVAVMVAAALLGVLAALTFTSLRGRPLPTWVHVLITGLSLGAVAALFFPGLVETAITIGIGLVAAALGAVLTLGRPSWRRYAIVTGIAVLAGLVLAATVR